MQALYAFFQGENSDLQKGEKDLFFAIDKIHDMYYYLLSLLLEVRLAALRISEDGKQKHRPTQEELSPNMRFVENKIFLALDKTAALRSHCEKQKINWQDEGELVRKILASVRAGDEYKKYMNATFSFDNDKAFVLEIYKNYIAEYELLEHFFEEKSIFWVDDMGLVNSCVLRTIESLKETDTGVQLMPLYKNEEEDSQFARDLFHQTVLRNAENEKYISDKTQNWDVDRIAMMDVLLMKMAISEILSFETIPVKVTLNEYIEISKMFSTPKSKIFINGILDKLVQDFRREEKLNKTGRGLIE